MSRGAKNAISYPEPAFPGCARNANGSGTIEIISKTIGLSINYGKTRGGIQSEFGPTPGNQWTFYLIEKTRKALW